MSLDTTARLDSSTRQHILREMGIELMVLRTAGPDAHQGHGKCLLLVPQSARDVAPQSNLVGKIAAALALPKEQFAVIWVQANSSASLPSHDACLILGDLQAADACGPDEALHRLSSPAELLASPGGKRDVWRAVRTLRRYLIAEA